MKLTDKWSSLTFFNEDEEHPQKISIKLSGIEGRGGAGLHPDKQYYIYDFWNDKLIGTFGGNETLEQELRHLLQGLLELSEVFWNEETKELTGYAELVEGESMHITIATNGWQPQHCTVADNEVACSLENNSENFVKLVLKSTHGGKVSWKFSFKK